MIFTANLKSKEREKGHEYDSGNKNVKTLKLSGKRKKTFMHG